MILVKSVPLTPGQRFLVKNKLTLSKNAPVAQLTKGFQRSVGRNCYGRVTCRHRGSGHKRLYRFVDFKRNKLNIPAVVESIEYDPNRSAHLALLKYADGEKRYILAPEELNIGDSVVSLNERVTNYRVGMNFPLSCIPLSVTVHAVELTPGNGAQLARSAGAGLELVSLENGYASLKMPSGEIRLVDARCRATIGRVGNVDHQNVILGKAGRKRWKGFRPSVRGVAMNPVDHPMGGGQTGGGNHPVSPWGQFAKGFMTRKRSNKTNKYILIRRNGKKVKKG